MWGKSGVTRKRCGGKGDVRGRYAGKDSVKRKRCGKRVV